LVDWQIGGRGNEGHKPHGQGRGAMKCFHDL
jgi:hypothetical protein